MSGQEEDGFLGRWSRLKRTQLRTERAAELSEAPAPLPESLSEPLPAPLPEQETAEAATLGEEELAALPRIEDLVEGSDIRPFLRAGVPRPLRNAAMRRIWMLTPAIRDHNDPAVDYAWDWNTPGGVPGDGVAPSPERAAEMLRDLFAPRDKPVAEAPEEDVPLASDEAVATATVTPSGPEEAPVAQPVEQSMTQPVAQSVAQAGERAGDQSEEAPGGPFADLPRRRHGSALPG